MAAYSISQALEMGLKLQEHMDGNESITVVILMNGDVVVLYGGWQRRWIWLFKEGCLREK